MRSSVDISIPGRNKGRDRQYHIEQKMQLSVQVNTYLCILKATEKEKKKGKKTQKTKNPTATTTNPTLSAVCSLSGEQASSLGSWTDLHLTTHTKTKAAPAHRSTHKCERPCCKNRDAIKLEGSMHHSPRDLLPLPPQTPPPCPETHRCLPGSCFGAGTALPTEVFCFRVLKE